MRLVGKYVVDTKDKYKGDIGKIITKDYNDRYKIKWLNGASKNIDVIGMCNKGYSGENKTTIKKWFIICDTLKEAKEISMVELL